MTPTSDRPAALRAVTTVLQARRASKPVMAMLVLAAVAIAVGCYEHGKLWNEGYRDIPNIGTAFALNVLGSAAAVIMLATRRLTLFALTAISLSAGSIVGIVMSRNGGFLGFQELGYESTAVITLVAEGATLALVATALLVVARDRRASAGERGPGAAVAAVAR